MKQTKGVINMDKSEILDSAEVTDFTDKNSIRRLFDRTKRAYNTFYAMHEIIAEQADKLYIKDCDIDEQIQQASKGGNKHG
jgi:hypothetical protein